jgi:hypothetical protein
MDCKRIPSAERWDEASVQQLEQYRNHIKVCLACRRRVYKESPDQLLQELNGGAMPEEFWIGFWESLENKLTPVQEKRYHLPLLPVVRWAAALIVVLLLALYENKLPESPSYEISRGGSQVRPFDSIHIDPSPYPLIEEVQEPGSTYAIFEAAGDQKIVMIFNPDIEL